jgi:hypothetical protein
MTREQELRMAQMALAALGQEIHDKALSGIITRLVVIAGDSQGHLEIKFQGADPYMAQGMLQTAGFLVLKKCAGETLASEAPAEPEVLDYSFPSTASLN